MGGAVLLIDIGHLPIGTGNQLPGGEDVVAMTSVDEDFRNTVRGVG